MLNVICCGGAGSNVGKQITDLDVNTFFIDTSTSNLKGVDENRIYKVEGIDGAGKDRKITHENFKNPDEVILHAKLVGKVVVLVHSLSGGSGSIIGPVMARELVKQGFTVFVVVIDSTTSVIEIDNCIKTLKTYKSFSNGLKKSFSIYPIHNGSRKEADGRAISFINLLSLLVNKEHTEEFDTSDLRNFVNFDNVTDNEPNVSIIEINANESIVPEKNTSIVSTVLLTTDKNSSIKPVIPEYLSVCVVTDKNYKNEDIRIDNVLGKLSLIVGGYEAQKKECSDNKRINKFNDVEVGETTDDGAVV